MLDWNTLSSKGTLFDPVVLEAAVDEKKIMHRKGDILIIRLKTVKVPEDQLSTTSFEEAAQYTALHFQLMFEALSVHKKLVAVEMRHFD